MMINCMVAVGLFILGAADFATKKVSLIVIGIWGILGAALQLYLGELFCNSSGHIIVFTGEGKRREDWIWRRMDDSCDGNISGCRKSDSRWNDCNNTFRAGSSGINLHMQKEKRL